MEQLFSASAGHDGQPGSHLSQFKGFPVLRFVWLATMMAEEAITGLAVTVTARRRWNPPRIGRWCESLLDTVVEASQGL